MISPNESESSPRGGDAFKSVAASLVHSRPILNGREISVGFNNRPFSKGELSKRDQVEIAILFRSARYVLSSSDSTSRVQTGEICEQQTVVVAAGVPHAWESREPGDVVWIWVDRSLVDRVTHAPLPEVSVIGPSLALQDISSLRHVTEILRDLVDDSDPCGFLIETIASAVAGWILYSIDLMHPVQPEPQPGLTVNELGAVIQHMQSNLKHEIHVVDLARKIGRSVQHFAELFKNTTGQPPYEYLTQLRMLKAFELLMTSNRPVHEVAREVGFTDPEHFSEKFQKYMRCSPRQVLRSARLESVNHRLFSEKRPEQS